MGSPRADGGLRPLSGVSGWAAAASHGPQDGLESACLVDVRSKSLSCRLQVTAWLCGDVWLKGLAGSSACAGPRTGDESRLLAWALGSRGHSRGESGAGIGRASFRVHCRFPHSAVCSD